VTDVLISGTIACREKVRYFIRNASTWPSWNSGGLSFGFLVDSVYGKESVVVIKGGKIHKCQQTTTIEFINLPYSLNVTRLLVYPEPVSSSLKKDSLSFV